MVRMLEEMQTQSLSLHVWLETHAHGNMRILCAGEPTLARSPIMYEPVTSGRTWVSCMATRKGSTSQLVALVLAAREASTKDKLNMFLKMGAWVSSQRQ